jgi:ABC-type transport system substrate-binding protein
MLSSASRASAVLVGLVAIAALVAGCAASPGPSGAPSATPSSSGPAEPTTSAAPTPEPAASFDPAADADENRPIVDAALAPLVAAGGIPAGRAVVDALTGAGIPVSALQVTPDETAIGLDVDALLFSVLTGESCVLGQFDGDGYTSTTAPALSTGQCLIGATASLD